MAHKHKRSDSEQVNPLQSIMSLIVVLIPILLISAEFTKISLVDAGISPDSGIHDAPSTLPQEEKTELLLPAGDTSLVVVNAKGMPSYFYKRVQLNPEANSHVYLGRETEETYSTVHLHEEVATLLRKIRREHSTSGKLLVGADSSVAYETVVEIMDGARLAGFDDIAFRKARTRDEI